jgi:hypothetical protein
VAEHIQAFCVDVERVSGGQPLEVLAYALYKPWGGDVYVAALLKPADKVVAYFLFGTATMQLLLAGAVEGLHAADHATCSGNSPVDCLARLLLPHAMPRL